MKCLTIMTVSILPFNIVSGLFGMNVAVPFVGSDYPKLTAFWVILGMCSFTSLLLVYMFKRYKWL